MRETMVTEWGGLWASCARVSGVLKRGGSRKFGLFPSSPFPQGFDDLGRNESAPFGRPRPEVREESVKRSEALIGSSVELVAKERTHERLSHFSLRAPGRRHLVRRVCVPCARPTRR